MKCRNDCCKAVLKEPCSHDRCRSHALCKTVKKPGFFTIWDPADCQICTNPNGGAVPKGTGKAGKSGESPSTILPSGSSESAVVMEFKTLLAEFKSERVKTKHFDPRNLPESTSSNPWLYAGTLAISEGQIYMGPLGMSHLSDLQFYPDFAAYPDCYVRLLDGSSFRVDTIPKETVLYDAKKMQEVVVGTARCSGFVNTQMTAFDRYTHSGLGLASLTLITRVLSSIPERGKRF